MKYFLLAIALFIGTSTLSAQDRSVEAVQIISELRKASSVYATQNHIYVVESGRHRILKLDHNGVLVETMGGLGGGNYQLDTPIDIDATNGLKIYISDSRNNRIQIFDRRFQYLTSIMAAGRPRFDRSFVPKQIAVNNFGEIIFYDEATKSFHRFNENGNFSESFRLPSKITEVTDIQSGGRVLYIFDGMKKQYHMISDNGLRLQSFPVPNALAFYADQKDVEWVFNATHMYDVRNPGNPVYWDYELGIKDVSAIGNTFFLLTSDSIYKFELPE